MKSKRLHKLEKQFIINHRETSEDSHIINYNSETVDKIVDNLEDVKNSKKYFTYYSEEEGNYYIKDEHLVNLGLDPIDYPVANFDYGNSYRKVEDSLIAEVDLEEREDTILICFEN